MDVRAALGDQLGPAVHLVTDKVLHRCAAAGEAGKARRRMPLSCSLRGESQKTWRPSAQRARITENSASKSMPASATAGSSPIAPQAEAASAGERTQAWPLPS